MQKQNYMQVSQDQPNYSPAPLQLLLFVDERPSSQQQLQRIRQFLQELQVQQQFDLEIIDVGEQPYLAEHFKLVATPALIKIHPPPRQILAGSNIIGQLKNWWPRWQIAVEEYLNLQEDAKENSDNNNNGTSSKVSLRSSAVSGELLQMSDEIFRLKQENEKLQEQLKFKDRVIGMLAHDLRNPLTYVSMAIETLESNNNPQKSQFSQLKPQQTAQLFQQTRAQVRKIDRMITDLLQVARGTDIEIRIQPQKLDIGKLCLDMLEELGDRYSAKSQKINTDIPKDLPCVYADPERIRQVLINLLDNAIKYTPEQGIITVAGLHRTTQKVQLSIGDTGPGIPSEKREQIFENHYRLERDEAKEGYGIGLSLCQRIIRAHYGQIWVDSTANGGAWFHFTLPVYPF
ncbi:MAG: histidine kinase [Nostocaceae cyanobacterium]|nr:histidine kinase [Nostocaceae cyanobacterium]